MQRAASLRRPYGLIRSKAPVLGAAYGNKPTPNLENKPAQVSFYRDFWAYNVCRSKTH
jgi:hypothetical protein